MIDDTHTHCNAMDSILHVYVILKKTEEPNELVSTLQKLIHTSQYKHTKKKHYDTGNIKTYILYM